MPERLLGPREVGERLGFKRTKVYEVLNADPPPFPVVRLNPRVLRVREVDLDAWIAAGCPVPASESAAGEAAPAPVTRKRLRA